MRLIDADALIEFIDPGHLRHPGKLAFSETDVVNMLNHSPEAYKVDNVIGKLKECIESSIHPKKSRYVNLSQNCLHLWKPIGRELDELVEKRHE